MVICLPGQSQEEVPRQRSPAIARWHLCPGSKGTERPMARCQANVAHTHLYIQQDDNGCLERFGSGIPSGEMPETEMALCQT